MAPRKGRGRAAKRPDRTATKRRWHPQGPEREWSSRSRRAGLPGTRAVLEGSALTLATPGEASKKYAGSEAFAPTIIAAGAVHRPAPAIVTEGRDRRSGLGAVLGDYGLGPVPERSGARSNRKREAPSPVILNDLENANHPRPFPARCSGSFAAATTGSSLQHASTQSRSRSLHNIPRQQK
jgi:hypothetical protein